MVVPDAALRMEREPVMRLSNPSPALLVLFLALLPGVARAVVPTDFVEQTVASGLSSPVGMAFGPDGMLSLSLGDDGSGCPAQDPTYLAGKILRFDVRSLPTTGTGPPLRSDLAPADNPFSTATSVDQRLVWAYGLRNPFRFAVDLANGSLLLADVG